MLWLAGIFMGEVGAYKIFHGACISVDGGHGYGRARGHKIFQGACTSVVGSHGLGKEQVRTRYLAESALLWLAATVMGKVMPKTYFAEPALLITVVGWLGYGRGRGP